MIQQLQEQKIIEDAKKQIQSWRPLVQQLITSVPLDEIHSGKEFRGIAENPAEIIKQFSGDIPLGHNGCGYSAPSIHEEDVRQYRYMIALALSELRSSHIRLTGPTGAGKSEFLYRLVVNLIRNHNWSIVWFSTKLLDDLSFFDDLGVDYTVISANDSSLTRRTKGRFNPLSRIRMRRGRVNIQDCRKLAAVLINLIPLDQVFGETQKFKQWAADLLAAFLELMKYHYGEQATLEPIPEFWTVLSEGEKMTHPLLPLLRADCVPNEAKHRLRRLLLSLLQPQRPADAMVGTTAQLLLNQIPALLEVVAADDIPNFRDRLRNAQRGHVLVIDQSDGLNACMSKGLARVIFPLLYEDLVAQSPPDWQSQGLLPVLTVIDEMNSVYAESELSDFLEKARSKGVIFAFGQQTSGNTDPHLDAAMSNNTRIQITFSGCSSEDPQVRELNAVAGRFTPKLDLHRDEPGFVDRERLPIDAIVNIGPLATIIRVKSVTNKDRIMWVHQGNPLVPYRPQIRALRDQLAHAIQTVYDQESPEAELMELCHLYAQTKQLLLYSYGYWTTDELRTAFASLDLNAINRSFIQTMQILEQQNQTARNAMVLAHSRPEFERSHLASLSLAMQDREWQMEFHQQTMLESRRYEKACEYENWLWNLFLSELPQIQKHRLFIDPDPIKQPKLRWWNAMFGVHFPNQVAFHAQAVLIKYQEYAQRFGSKNPGVWQMIEPLVRLRVTGELTDTFAGSLKTASLAEVAKRSFELF